MSDLIKFLLNYALADVGPFAEQPAGGPSGDALLLESGDYLLLESGDYLLLE